MKASKQDIVSALDSPNGRYRFFLLYGPDEAGSAALAARLKRAMGEDAERIDIDGSTLSSDPARLADEAASLSLFGGKRYVRIQPAGDESAAAVENLLSLASCENPVVAIAGVLKPSSALLKLALAHPNAMAFISYAPSGAEADNIAIELAREVGLRLGRAEARMISACTANDRSLMALELEKIALYLDASPERPMEVTVEAINAISASINDVAFSALTEAVMGGRPAKAAQALEKLAAENISAIPSVKMLQKRALQIAELRAEMAEKNASANSVIESRGKAIFFRDKPAILQETNAWQPDALGKAMDILLSAERALKGANNAGDILGDAELIRLSRVAARFR